MKIQVAVFNSWSLKNSRCRDNILHIPANKIMEDMVWQSVIKNYSIC